MTNKTKLTEAAGNAVPPDVKANMQQTMQNAGENVAVDLAEMMGMKITKNDLKR